MKPRILKIKGLNSFKEQQIINFEKLTENGFFGIFGPTGCGKSSILDAITYALYGKIIRDNTGFINSTEATVEVSYEFEIGLGKEKKVYVVDRAAKRDKKTGGYRATIVRISEKINGNLLILADKKSEIENYISEIIGLTMEDFTRAVVLPQGKFSEFLKTAPSDRRDMLERIFALYKYGRGLGEKIKASSKANKEMLDVLCGKLSQYEGVSEEALIAIKGELCALIQEEKILKEEKIIIDNQYEKYKSIWELQKELRLYEEKELKLLEKEEDISSSKSKLERGKASFQVRPFIDNLYQTNEKFKSNEVELNNLMESLRKLEKKLQITSEEYTESLCIKDKNIPLLVEKEANLKQAIEFENLKKRRTDERKALVEEYRIIMEDINNLEANLKTSLLDREEKNCKLRVIEVSISNNKIEPEYREKLGNGYMKEKDYSSSLKNIEKLEEKIKASINVLEEEKIEFQEVLNNQVIKNKELENQELVLNELEKRFPGDNVLIIEKIEHVNLLKKFYGEAKENEDKRQRFINEVELIKREIIKFNSTLEIDDKALLSYEENITKISEKVNKINSNNLASTLASKLKDGEQCPVCGSRHFVHLAEPIEDDQLKKYEDNKLEFEGITKELKLEIKENEIKKASLEAELKHKNSEFDLLTIKLQGIELSLRNINISGYTQNLELFERFLECNEKELNELKYNIEKWNKDKLQAEKSMNLLKDKNSKSLLNVAGFKEGISKDAENIEVLNGEHENACNEFKIIEIEYFTFKEELCPNLNSELPLSKRYNDMLAIDREMKKLETEEEKLRLSIVFIDKGKEEKETRKIKLYQEEAKIKQSGVEKKNSIEDYEKQIDRLSEGMEPNAYILEVKREKKNITDIEASLKKELDEEKLIKQSSEQKKAASEKNKETLNLLIEEQSLKLKFTLIENDFKDIGDAERCFINKSNIQTMELDIKTFEEKISNVKNSKSNIKYKLKGETIEAEKWSELKENRKIKEELLNHNTEEKIKKSNDLTKMEENLSIIKKLVNEKKSLSHRESLLKELEKLVQANKMVEFVATSQLRYVAAEASKRLKSITRGRYALELDIDGSFVMRDDFNGGLRRSTNSLSGGETFLTSLSLALALSSQIQLKGKNQLEFFFLDEGFGTLDSEFLDIVMTSLESLRSDKLCVGIISHVEEIKNRVPIKLMVTGANLGEGTKVQIEKS